ncbi:ImmA/IrrE family metallo-endopeptidase [Anaerofustis butyriciformans]|uniref:ImmA/IrrE family metallo-endopeptidase n=1 Tax=Anaerofustis butyriciformans TaxID=3108533 RepID=UPI002E380EFB|nr:ImmA/IrrE family metallo-endopeptidase [Anaerofustis sp. HA2171]
MTFRLSDQRCEEIKDIVVSTFEKLDIRCIPISGFEIATKLGAMIIPYSSKSIEEQKLMLKESEDGFSIKYNGTWYIFYNDRKGYGRTNNTLTHECGHIVLDHSQESNLAEAEAKFFAKYAIAPPVLIHKLNLKNSLEVYNHFYISLQAASYAFSYYQKWLTYGNKDYTNYELRLLQLFSKAM